LREDGLELDAVTVCGPAEFAGELERRPRGIGQRVDRHRHETRDRQVQRECATWTRERRGAHGLDHQLPVDLRRGNVATSEERDGRRHAAHIYHPGAGAQRASCAALSPATSSFTILSIASETRRAFWTSGSVIRSPRMVGTICQDTPNLSLS